MGKTVAIGVQDFATLRERELFYIDKTGFIKDWWESNDDVTLITRPRRFGKTLNMSMLTYFFSNRFADRGDLFEGLSIWEDEKYREIQGTYPVIFLSFADVKQADLFETKEKMNGLIADLYKQYDWMIHDAKFTDADREEFYQVKRDMSNSIATETLKRLCEWLHRYYGKKCIVLIDEYDTPLQEAYIYGYWDEITAYIRSLFNSTFKTNPYLERGVMTGITRVSKESMFSDLNNLNVVTTTSDEYATCFGFTEEEVFAAMDAQGIDASEKERVKHWYDGFIFGDVPDIYNPWSVTLYLDKKKFDTYWANTSGNALAGKLIREGEPELKMEFERLIKGESIQAYIDEQIVFNQLDGNTDAIWSLLLASGYLKVLRVEFEQFDEDDIYSDGDKNYTLALTNFEVRTMFRKMVSSWFKQDHSFDRFTKAMLRGDEYEMNRYMNDVALNTFSSFDSGTHPSKRTEPERFYHGFVLGLMVDKAKDYIVKSNRESGYGRYDVVMEPKNGRDTPAIIMEFKVFDEGRGEKTLSDTADSALQQIEEKKYDADLIARGIVSERIYKYGFAFEGATCLIKKQD